MTLTATVKAMSGRLRAACTGVGLLALAWFLHLTPNSAGHAYWPLPLVGGAALVVAPVVMWRHRRSGSSGLVGRWSNRSRRNQGVASPWAILRVSSAWAMRRKAKLLRPSLAESSLWRRWRVPIRELATPLARVGWLRIWSPIEDVTLRVGGPRVGKTGELGCRVLDAPGAVIATSTRVDVVKHTAKERAERGPVYVFNPARVGKLPPTVVRREPDPLSDCEEITFDPLSGCRDPKVATNRAADLLSGTSLADLNSKEKDWLEQAVSALAPLLHAAALSGGSMWDVLAWVTNPDAAAPDVMRHLRASPEVAFECQAEMFFTAGRPQSSIRMSIMPALRWMSDPAAVATTVGTSLDVAELLEQRGTVYLLGAEDAQTAPLLAALTGHIAREARRIAETLPGGRLDPPLTLVLDEAAIICPVPLDEWTADMGGRGVTIHIGTQSRAQLRQRWGHDGAAAIMNNAGTFMIYGGTRDDEDLSAYSALCGERWERVETLDSSGAVTSTTTNRVPVLSAAQIAQLPDLHAVIIRRGMPPAVGRPQMVWQRRGNHSGWLTAAGRRLLSDIRALMRARGKRVEPGKPRLRVVPDAPDREAA